MRKLVALVLAFAMIMSAAACVSYAGEKGASERARERASEQAVFNRVTDWFATVGKSPEEKESILAERQAIRAQKRAEREARKAEKAAEKAMKRGKEKVRGFQKKMK